MSSAGERVGSKTEQDTDVVRARHGDRFHTDRGMDASDSSQACMCSHWVSAHGMSALVCLPVTDLSVPAYVCVMVWAQCR
jgi:hypothetical protein